MTPLAAGPRGAVGRQHLLQALRIRAAVHGDLEPRAGADAQRIEVEQAARSSRSQLPPANRRVDSSRPMFSGRSHGLKGGGAFDPMLALLALTAAAAVLRFRS